MYEYYDSKRGLKGLKAKIIVVLVNVAALERLLFTTQYTLLRNLQASDTVPLVKLWTLPYMVIYTTFFRFSLIVCNRPIGCITLY